jgi:hypothetical protein
MSNETDYIIDQLEKEEKTLPVSKNRCIQHLAELGYLPVFKVNALFPGDVDKAKAQFLLDALDSGLYSDFELTKHSFVEEDVYLSELLGKAVDIDEGIVFDRLPEAGQVSLITRIIHYRLDIFGLWPHPVSNPFSVVNSIAALGELGIYAGCSDLEAVNYMADAEKLTRRLLETHPIEDFILAFRPAHKLDPNLEKALNKTARFRKQLVDDFGERSEFFKYLKKEVLKDNPDKVDFNFLNREMANPFKKFVLRLIQVHQWQEGLYEGLLDSDIGEVTIMSILAAIDIYNSAGNRNIKPLRVLNHITKGYFIFNALFFLQEYMVDDGLGGDVEDAEKTILSDMLRNIEHANDPALAAFESNLGVIKAEMAMASEMEPEEKRGLLKRIYFGIKKFFKKIVRISKNIFGWVVRLTGKFKGLLKKVFGHLFGKLSKGIKAFIDGIKFLFGQKDTTTTGNGGMISSVIRLDGDSYTITNNAVGLVDEHMKKISYNVTSMKFALSITGGVLRIVMNAVNVLSWPMLIFNITRIFREITESYRKLELITN